jgi:hypothetical protein
MFELEYHMSNVGIPAHALCCSGRELTATLSSVLNRWCLQSSEAATVHDAVTGSGYECFYDYLVA